MNAVAQTLNFPAATVRRIAIVRALYLGDLLLAVPAFRALRRGYPDAEITLVSLPWAVSFVERFASYIDRFVAFPGYPGFEEGTHDPVQTDAFLAEQRAHRYDLVIQMHGNGQTSNPLAVALGGRVTIGYARDAMPVESMYTETYPNDQPEIVRNVRLAGMAGCSDLSLELEFPLNLADCREAGSLLPGPSRRTGPLIGLHPGSKRPTRRWPAEYLAAVGDFFAATYGAQIVLTGSADEAGAVQAVASCMSVPALDLSGRTSLGGLAAVLEQLDLFVCNDTGPAHLAEAVGSPVVTVFGPGDYGRWAPMDRDRFPTVRHPVPCSPCLYWECPIDHRCLRWVLPRQVIDVAERLLMTKETACHA